MIESSTRTVLTVGITGGIGTGKTACAAIFELLGIPVYYSDHAAKQLMVSDPELIDGIHSLFGYESYHADGTLNRPHLASQIFSDESLLSKMNAIVHPAVARDFQRWRNLQDAPYVIQESALVYEIEIADRYDLVIAVDAPDEIRIDRVIHRDSTIRDQVKQRISKQLPQSLKVARADFVIQNNGQRSLIDQVMNLHNIIRVLQINKTNNYPIPPGIRAVIFDLDGTLADTMPGHLTAWTQLGQELGYPITDQMILDRCGTPTVEIAKQMNEMYGWDLNPDDVYRRKNEIYATIKAAAGPVQPIDHIMSIALRCLGILPMAIGTGSSRHNADKALSDMGVEDWFVAVISVGEVTWGKPHPETYLRCADALGIAPQHCLVYEDGPMGVSSAISAGMQVWDIRRNHFSVGSRSAQ